MPNLGMSVDRSANNLYDSSSNPIINRAMRKPLISEKLTREGSTGNGPQLDLRVSTSVYNKLHNKEGKKSILSTGGINFEVLSRMSENFNLGDYTNNSIHESMENIQTGINKRKSSKFQSGNKLFLILRKLREAPN
mmetsp:Transcript_34082/g.33626  ORF Transcript_34082/g.33626 Transcript_34082/m.33626 type:complete len:136 (+) Transcript_34082:1419-1826(+)